MNWGPLSHVIVAGTPKRLMQFENRTWAQSDDEVVETGNDSGQRVVLPMILKRCGKPKERGKGPTRSTWMWLKRRVGTGIGSTCVLVCRVILPFWEFKHYLVYGLMSFDKPRQTKREEMRRRVARTPG